MDGFLSDVKSLSHSELISSTKLTKKIKIQCFFMSSTIEDKTRNTLNLLKRTLQAINNTLTMFFDEEKSRKNDPPELCEAEINEHC